jgi:BirA family biotin operon repressor/biotin-[acetyl-CoA-carboxylase] ligase
MNAQRIAALSRADVAVEVVAETGSTNADLLARAGQLAHPVLLVAEHQSAAAAAPVAAGSRPPGTP